MPKKPAPPKDYEKNVFINCPFDDPYSSLFNAIVFAVHDIGFLPRSARETSNAGQNRLNKIMDIIYECKYGIHDLSRTELDDATGLPRFNMPLELGIDLGCRRFGLPFHREKILLVMDTEKYRYQQFISDISGQDIEAHGGNVEQLISVVREWLGNELDYHTFIVPSGALIFQRYQDFQAALPAICAKLNWDVNDLRFKYFSSAVADWIANNPLSI
jgi:hypothetical protein